MFWHSLQLGQREVSIQASSEGGAAGASSLGAAVAGVAEAGGAALVAAGG